MTGKQLREEIKYNLGFLTETNQRNFKRIYSPSDLDKDINKVVDEMPYKRLKWALQQVLTTKYKLFTILKANYE